MSGPIDLDEPTDEDLAAIMVALFAEEAETIQPYGQQSPWITAARTEAIEKWEQPDRFSRPVEIKVY